MNLGLSLENKELLQNSNPISSLSLAIYSI